MLEHCNFTEKIPLRVLYWKFKKAFIFLKLCKIVRKWSSATIILVIILIIMFIEKTDICNFAGDNTLYKTNPNLLVLLNCLRHGISIFLNWLKVNSLGTNRQTFQFMVLGGKCKIEGTYIFSKYKQSS